jgi:hypothetical protein
MTILEVEQLLDARRLQVKMTRGNAQTLRRNGMTKRWKRDPERFRIPVKHGFRGTGAIDSTDLDSLGIIVAE